MANSKQNKEKVLLNDVQQNTKNFIFKKLVVRII